jgi:stage V sporulation protein R
LDKDQYIIASREFVKIKARLLAQLTNAGQPLISIVDANHGNHGGLHLRHAYEGIPLDLRYAQATLENLFTLWKRPVSIETVYKDKPILIRADGQETKIEEISAGSVDRGSPSAGSP